MAVKVGIKSLVLTMGIDLYRIFPGVCIGCDTFLDMYWYDEYDD